MMAFKHGTLKPKNQKLSMLGGTDVAGHTKEKKKKYIFILGTVNLVRYQIMLIKKS